MLGRWRWGIVSLGILVAVGAVVWMKSTPVPGTLEEMVASDDRSPSSGGEADGPQSSNYKLPSPTAGATASQMNNQPAGQASPRAASTVSPDKVWTLDGNKVSTATTPMPAPVTAGEPVPAVEVSWPRAVGPVTSSGSDQTSSSAQPAAPQPATPGSARVTQPTTVNLNGGLADGFSLIEQGKRVEGRKLLSKLLVEGTLTPAEAQKVRDVLTVVNNTLIYSPRVTQGDPLVTTHVVQRGDRLVNIAIKYKIPHQFIEKINGINADRIQLDQKIKVVNGPFHAVVTKSAYRMDLYLKDPADGQMLYIRSFAVGLGADDSTPLGNFVVRPRSKVVNPGWTNPRTGETFSRDDPKNPIGEFWMGLEGVQLETASLAGYGIHGTIDQDSIGTQSSMGCVRLRDEDIAQVFYMLWEGETTVKIVP